jgi:putative tryptophan/tyrosine transport system substrate-binding protein
MRKIGFLCPGSCTNIPHPFNEWDRRFLSGLEHAGYVLGRNASVDLSGIGVGYGGLLAGAQKLVQHRVDVIVAVGNDAAHAARRATNSTPIVMLSVADAADEGLVASLGRPGANVTGLSVPLAHIAAKHVQLLKEINPQVARVGVLWSPILGGFSADRFMRLQRATASLDVHLSPLPVASRQDLEKGISSSSDGRPDSLLLVFEQLTGSLRGEIALVAVQQRMLTVASYRVFAEAGGLLAYGPYVAESYERAATFVGKVLSGARPSELPVEEPTRFELTINKATAKALGLTIPPSLLLRADQVIE